MSRALAAVLVAAGGDRRAPHDLRRAVPPHRRLRRGDHVTVALPYGTFGYAVTRRRVVDAADVSVLARTGRERLILPACHRQFSAARRMVVYARLVGVGRTARTLKRTASWTR